jgi:hypothetical protein
MIVRRIVKGSAAARSECNPQADIVVNGIAKNDPGGVVASKSRNANPVEAVKCDDVAFPCVYASDGPGRRIAGGDATIAVAQWHRSRDVSANLVALDDHVGEVTADFDTVGTRVYYIACPWRVATDRGVG